ncbi:alpha/beta fold hydrolase [Fulvivirga kasyanovii]|uniref:Alpha/beta fold hydrolase n=1 Tax=Fulvivirga kasyanovii TaxID=396812 RepID=A0ABW9RMU1_9BACT|nr:alpha/beta fold hydrolase [Fulvivirga kasyanovii]MTI24485.1 alpha/beta fold hydrolase [Fulvivirga kasyanovii]
MKFRLKLALLAMALILFSAPAPCQPGNEKSTFMLIHGSWHGDWSWYLLEEQLKKAGHTVITVNLPGHGLLYNNASQVTLQDYESAVVNALDLSQEEVILVGHSLGGLIISAAAEKRPDKVRSLVYLAAFLLKNGQSVLDISVQDSTSLIFPNTIIDSENKIVHLSPERVVDLFYEDAPHESVILSQKLLTPEPLLPLSAPLTITTENYGSIDRYYITTTQDKAISPYIQEKMYTETPCKQVFHINSGHSPFFSNVPQLKNILSNIAKEKGNKITDSKRDENQKPKPSSLQLTVYPNPAKETVNIVLPQAFDEISLTITTVQGEVLKTDQIKQPSSIISITLPDSKDKELLVLIKAGGEYYRGKVFRY